MEEGEEWREEVVLDQGEDGDFTALVPVGPGPRGGMAHCPHCNRADFATVVARKRHVKRCKV